MSFDDLERPPRGALLFDFDVVESPQRLLAMTKAEVERLIRK